jgi:hypothetical protein
MRVRRMANVEYSLKRNWIKSLLILSILFENPSGAMQRRAGFQVYCVPERNFNSRM